MDIDLSALRSLQTEKDISMDLSIKAIEDALLVAYHRSEGAAASARVEVNRRTGHVTVWAAETAEDGQVVREYDDTPDGFGRIAATTARQVILQRLRDAEDELTFGEYAGREGDVVAGVIQQGKDPRAVLVDLGKLEAMLPPSEQVPGERYVHGERLRCYVLHVRKGFRGPSVTLSRTHPNLVRKLFALEVPEIASGAVEIAAIAREAGHRSKIAVISHQQGVNAKGRVHRPDGQPGPQRHDRAARREDRHRGLLARSGPVRRARALAGPGVEGQRDRCRGAGGPGHRARLPAIAGHRQRGPECPAGRPADRLADRYPARHRR
jgi:N utilization substance protein A